MARLLLLFALCVLPAIVISAEKPSITYVVIGKVYCDTCRCGFETPATKYLDGAKVILECRNRANQELIYSFPGVTNSTGTYEILVNKECSGIADVKLVSSPDPECATPDKGRDCARVILTSDNGMTSTTRNANNMGFTRNEPMAGCAQVLRQYQEFDE